MTSDLLDTSAATWLDHGQDPPALDPRLRPPVDDHPRGFTLGVRIDDANGRWEQRRHGLICTVLISV